MLDILHNGVTKKVDGSLKETDGLLIISGVPKWVPQNGGDNYVALLVDPRIKETHAVHSVKVSARSVHTGITTTDLVADSVRVMYGMVRITVSAALDDDAIITITLYDIDKASTPSGMLMTINDAEVAFTDWNVTQPYEGIPVFSGTVTAKIEDDGYSAPSLATVVDDTFTLRHRDLDGTSIDIMGVKETLPDGKLVCNVHVEMAPGTEDPVFPTSVSSPTINYIYIASDTIRMTLPEADAEWVEQEGASVEDRGVIFYEATFAAEVPDNVSVSDVIVVHGENGEEFPAISSETRPKMYSYVTRTVSGAANIVVHWTRGTMPETTKLTAEVYAANYEAVDASSGDTPLHP